MSFNLGSCECNYSWSYIKVKYDHPNSLHLLLINQHILPYAILLFCSFIANWSRFRVLLGSISHYISFGCICLSRSHQASRSFTTPYVLHIKVGSIMTWWIFSKIFITDTDSSPMWVRCMIYFVSSQSDLASDFESPIYKYPQVQVIDLGFRQ